MSFSPCPYGHPSRTSAPGSFRDCLPDWSSGLPPEWRDQIIVPNTFRIFREYEIPARRAVGYDRQHEPCYCRYDYRLLDLRSDDDEDFYQALAYGESLTGWRLKNNHWLVHRCLESLGEEGERDSRFSLEMRMPS